MFLYSLCSDVLAGMELTFFIAAMLWLLCIVLGFAFMTKMVSIPVFLAVAEPHSHRIKSFSDQATYSAPVSE